MNGYAPSRWRRHAAEVQAWQLTADNLVTVADWMSDHGTHCDQCAGHLAFLTPWGRVLGSPMEHAEPGDWIVTVDPHSGFWRCEDGEFRHFYTRREAAGPGGGGGESAAAEDQVLDP